MDRCISDITAWFNDNRVPLNFSCTATAVHSEIAGILTDLSYSGACIEIDPDDLSFPLSDLRRIEVDGMGGFDIIYRWQRGDKIGVSFRTEDFARPKIAKFFEKSQGSARA